MNAATLHRIVDDPATDRASLAGRLILLGTQMLKLAGEVSRRGASGGEPRDAALLLVLGRLCARQGLWGKAQSYLEASIAIEPSWSAHHALAQLQEKLGNAEAAHSHARESLAIAIAQLRQVTGGRRRTPL